MTGDVAAHDQAVTHRYVVAYPEHPAREGDPHYVDFHHIHETWKADPAKWVCQVGAHRQDFTECDLTRPLELHHAHVEFSLQNGIDLRWLAADYPGIDQPDEVGAWVESAANLMVLCVVHHRTLDGVHKLTASDWEAEKYVRGLIKP
jgi:hypothetical protein